MPFYVRDNMRESLAYTGASLIEDKKSVFVGTDLLIIAAMLAKKTHAPNLLIVFEAGGRGQDRLNLLRRS